MERPTQREGAGWDQAKTLSVYYDLGLTKGRSLREWKIEILKYFKVSWRKRAGSGGGSTPSTAPVTGCRRLGQTPETVRQLPIPGASESAVGEPTNDHANGEAANGGVGRQGGNREDPTAQRRFTRSMARTAAMEPHEPPTQEDGQ